MNNIIIGAILGFVAGKAASGRRNPDDDELDAVDRGAQLPIRTQMELMEWRERERCRKWAVEALKHSDEPWES